jgi:hypothetical protein
VQSSTGVETIELFGSIDGSIALNGHPPASQCKVGAGDSGRSLVPAWQAAIRRRLSKSAAIGSNDPDETLAAAATRHQADETPLAQVTPASPGGTQAA